MHHSLGDGDLQLDTCKKAQDMKSVLRVGEKSG